LPWFHSFILKQLKQQQQKKCNLKSLKLIFLLLFYKKKQLIIKSDVCKPIVYYSHCLLPLVLLLIIFFLICIFLYNLECLGFSLFTVTICGFYHLSRFFCGFPLFPPLILINFRLIASVHILAKQRKQQKKVYKINAMNLLLRPPSLTFNY